MSGVICGCHDLWWGWAESRAEAKRPKVSSAGPGLTFYLLQHGIGVYFWGFLEGSR